MTPEFYDAFLAKKQAILATGLDFINCAELHLNRNNIGNYDGENHVHLPPRATSPRCGAGS